MQSNRLSRLRRLRQRKITRDWVSETQLEPTKFILPYFVIDKEKTREPINSMPGIYRLSIDNLLKDIKESQELGIKSILLFGIPKVKDEFGKSSYDEDGIIQRAVKAVKENFKDITIITDICLCAYTSHGHCGIIKNMTDYTIDNDLTVEILAKVALSHAQAGADFVAPSAMMDHQVKAIRQALDKAGFKDTGILAYSAKYASNFYGPFREALDSRPKFTDRKAYQMDYRNSNEALREIEQDINEGADIVMIKPALAYLDIIYKAKQSFNIPIAAYNVSGEYTMIKKLSDGDKQLEKELVLEVLTCIKRAGADIIISYFAKEVAGWLKAK